MTTLARRQPPGLAGLLDWLETDVPFGPMLRARGGEQFIRLEESLTDDQYILRAEVPGIDPDKDVDISIDDGVLQLSAERKEEKKENSRTEFRYGRFSRTIQLPHGVNEDDVAATYKDGILELRIGLKEPKQPEAKRITVTRS